MPHIAAQAEIALVRGEDDDVDIVGIDERAEKISAVRHSFRRSAAGSCAPGQFEADAGDAVMDLQEGRGFEGCKPGHVRRVLFRISVNSSRSASPGPAKSLSTSASWPLASASKAVNPAGVQANRRWCAGRPPTGCAAPALALEPVDDGGDVAVRDQQHPAKLAHADAVAAPVKGGHHVQARQRRAMRGPEIVAQVVCRRPASRQAGSRA